MGLSPSPPQLTSNQPNPSQINTSQLKSNLLNSSQLNSNQVMSNQNNSTQTKSTQPKLSEVKSTHLKSSELYQPLPDIVLGTLLYLIGIVSPNPNPMQSEDKGSINPLRPSLSLYFTLSQVSSLFSQNLESSQTPNISPAKVKQ